MPGPARRGGSWALPETSSHGRHSRKRAMIPRQPGGPDRLHRAGAQVRRIPKRVLTPAVQRTLWALALFIFLAGGFFSFFLPVCPKGGPPVNVTFERGLSSAGIARKLEDAGLIRSRLAIELAAVARGRVSRLKAGTYQFSGGQSLWALIDSITAGQVADLVLTIPEGLNSREIADRVAPVIQCTPEAFLDAVNDSVAAVALGIPTRNFEGYLF